MEWRNIEKYDGYKVYENGDVYCRDEKVEPWLHKIWDVYYVSMRKCNKYNCTNPVAKVVYETFKEKVRDGTKLVYIDENPLNYCLSNLKVVNRYKKLTPEKPIELDKNKKWKPKRRYVKIKKISNK